MRGEGGGVGDAATCVLSVLRPQLQGRLGCGCRGETRRCMGGFNTNFERGERGWGWLLPVCVLHWGRSEDVMWVRCSRKFVKGSWATP